MPESCENCQWNRKPFPLCHNFSVNWEQMKKNVGARAQLKPTPRRVDDYGRKLPPVDDDWIIEEVSANGVRIKNVRTHHTTILGPGESVEPPAVEIVEKCVDADYPAPDARLGLSTVLLLQDNLDL